MFQIGDKVRPTKSALKLFPSLLDQIYTVAEDNSFDTIRVNYFVWSVKWFILVESKFDQKLNKIINE